MGSSAGNGRPLNEHLDLQLISAGSVGNAEPLGMSADGRYVLITDAQRGRQQCDDADRLGRGSENVAPTAFTPEISPDGLRVAYQPRSHGILLGQSGHLQCGAELGGELRRAVNTCKLLTEPKIGLQFNYARSGYLRLLEPAKRD